LKQKEELAMALSLKEIRNKTRELAKGSCRVCPVCDGRVCSGEVPGMGGTGSGVSFRNNVSALAEIKLNTKLVHSARFPVTETEILGFKLRLPLIIAPIGGIAFNLAGAMDEAAYQEAITFGAVDAGIIASTPDAVPIDVMKTGLAMTEKLGQGRAIPFIKPWELDKIKERLEMVKKAGCRVVGCDLDSIGLITLRIMGNPAYPKNEKELAAIIKTAHDMGLSFIAKGIMGSRDALACTEAGADGLLVSNHGGRVLDAVPGTAEVLPEVAEIVKGRVALLVDGGIRTGVDILKMLALGADGVMIGRPYSVAAIGGGREGVALFTETLHSQLVQAMIMTGCANVKDAGRDLLYKR
jgi:isopentenyl diphosphate isomerase/L-lactate dehydrogenase-like FMN-dependent dehydrogenase